MKENFFLFPQMEGYMVLAAQYYMFFNGIDGLDFFFFFLFKLLNIVRGQK